MKKKDLKDIRSKKIDELRKMVDEKKKEAAETFSKTKGGQESNVKKYKNQRKDIAQILTVIREKEIIEKMKKEKKKEAKK